MHTFTHRQIRAHIAIGALMSLGAENITYTTHDDWNVVEFTARILPFRKNGERGTRVRKMRVQIYQDPVFPETLALSVDYITAGKYKSHLTQRHIELRHLSSFLVALDYDGEQALNPRITSSIVGSKNRCQWYPECGGEATALRDGVAVCASCAAPSNEDEDGDEIHGDVCEVCRQAVGLGDAGEISETNPGWNVNEFRRNAEKYEAVVNDDEGEDRFCQLVMCAMCDTWESGTRWPVVLTERSTVNNVESVER